MILADLIAAERDPIVNRWVERTYETTAPRSLARVDVLNDMRAFVAELELRLRGDLSDGGDNAPPLQVAQSHGRQRFEIGYDIAAIIREQSILHDIIQEVIVEECYQASDRERISLSRFLYAALADAANCYAIERDREVRVQAERYVSFLAHELRSPLGTAMLAVSVMRERQELPDGRASASLERALAQMHGMVDGALSDFTVRSSPKPVCKPLDLREFLADITSESESHAESKGVRCTIAMEEPIEFDADPKLLRSAVSNLVRNAIKFSAPGGEVRLEGKRGEGRVIIAVRDSCGGLPEGSVERLFNPFVQAGEDRTGFGLGLAIAKQAAECHQGAIRVHDVPGTGCVFVIDLPERCA